MKEIAYKDKIITLPLKKDDLEFLYCHEKLSCPAISTVLGIGESVVYRAKIKYEIDTVQVWDRHALPEKLDNFEREVALGYLLGDGHAKMPKQNAYIRISQCKEQLPFVNQLYSIFEKWASHPPREDVRYEKRYNKNLHTYRFDTVTHPAFNEIYNLCYNNKTKIVTQEWLNLIGPTGLAMWYQGDGSLEAKVVPMLHTQGFGLDEQHLIVKWFKDKHNIDSHIRKKSGRYLISIDSGSEFRDLIKQHMISYFDYKLPEDRQRKYYPRKQKNT